MHDPLTKAMTDWCDHIAVGLLAKGWIEISTEEASSFMAKGFAKKYLRREATNNPRHPWRYFYRPVAAKPHAEPPPIKFVPSSPHLPQETWQTHFTKHPDDGGVPSEDRHATVHADIIRHTLGDKPRKKLPTATFIIGGMGSGKSTTLNAGRSHPDAVRIDPDEIRHELPEFKKATEDDNAVARDAGSKTQEEASWLAKHIRDKAIERHNDLLIDTSGRNHASLSSVMERLKARGYRIHLIGVHVDAEEGIRRIQARAAHSRRDVPEKLARASYAAFPGSFDKLKDHAHSYEAWSTSAESKGHNGKSERAIKLLSKKAGSPERQHVPKLAHKLLRKPLAVKP